MVKKRPKKVKKVPTSIQAWFLCLYIWDKRFLSYFSRHKTTCIAFLLATTRNNAREKAGDDPLGHEDECNVGPTWQKVRALEGRCLEGIDCPIHHPPTAAVTPAVLKGVPWPLNGCRYKFAKTCYDYAESAAYYSDEDGKFIGYGCSGSASVVWTTGT